MLLQPDSGPFSQEQLATEVKSIYAILTIVESKCIHVDKTQALAMREGEVTINVDHWQSLIALHKTLLHKHHDFFLARQHLSASQALRQLASKYSMPARMWKHGIHSFLGLLRYQLPTSLDFMMSFIYTAYTMMSLLYETVPAFSDTSIECLVDLGRNRMVIEDEYVQDREHWASISRFWYTKAADNACDYGRLYHHLAILARPNALQQLSLYARSLRYQRPESLDFIMSFIYTTYDMMSLLYETVPAFDNTRIEYLGDLGRYRTAIEDEDMRAIRPYSTAGRANPLVIELHSRCTCDQRE